MTDLPLTKVSETTKFITLGWTPVPCEGYAFLAGGIRVSNTWNQNQSSVKFTKVASGQYAVRALGVVAEGVYPPIVPPPPGNVFDVPTSIDSTGATDVTAALQAWVASVPDGTSLVPNVLRFNGGTYRVQTMLNVTSRNNLTFDCSTPTALKWTTPVTLSGTMYVGNDSLRLLRFGDCKNITLKSLTLLGASPMPATGDGFKPWENVQHMHTLCVSRCENMVIDGVTIDMSGGGDGINWGNENSGFRSTGTIRNCTIRNAHRCGIAVVGSGGLTVANTLIERIGAWPVDLEPNTFESGNYNTVLDTVTFGSQAGLVERPALLAFAGSKDGHGECVGLTIRNSKAVGRRFDIRLNSHDYSGTYPYPLRIKTVRLENNTADSGGVGEMCQVDGLDVVGNNFPVTVRDCTDYRPADLPVV